MKKILVLVVISIIFSVPTFAFSLTSSTSTSYDEEGNTDSQSSNRYELVVINKKDFLSFDVSWDQQQEINVIRNKFRKNPNALATELSKYLIRENLVSIDEIEEIASQGNIIAQQNLGNLFLNSDVVQNSAENAFKWYLLAAKQGDWVSQVQVGLFYYYAKDEGFDFIQQTYNSNGNDDYMNALKWFLLAINQEEYKSNPSYQYILMLTGDMYFEDYGPKKDVRKARKFLEVVLDIGGEGFSIDHSRKLLGLIDAEEKRVADAKKEKELEKKAKDAGYESYAEMQLEEKRIADEKRAEEKRKAEEAKRIAEEKRAEEKRKAEEAKRIAEEKRKEGKETEKNRINAIIQESKLRAETNPGFRDLKPGALYKVFSKHCKGNKCYGLQNIKFSAESYREFSSSIGRSKEGVSLIRNLILDMGPIVASDGSFTSFLNDLTGESNIYMKMKQNLDAKYALDYEYSERDRQLFNEQEKDDLLGVYSNGQVAIRINRKERENSYSKDLWLYIEYRDVKSGKQFLEKNRPVIATLDDF